VNWEESKALTPLKRAFLEAFFEQNQSFYLTGGSALGIFYLGHRLSYDLDLFTQDSVEWRLLRNEMMRIADGLGARLKSLTSSPEFHRFELVRGEEREIIDLAVEGVPQVDPEKQRFGRIRVDTLREIMTNKVCTLVERSEIKDLVDLYFLNKRGYRVADYLELARTKEGGLDPATISHLLSGVSLDEVPTYMLEPLNLADFRSFVEALRKEMADRAFPT
jgi:hypothetical protein